VRPQISKKITTIGRGAKYVIISRSFGWPDGLDKLIPTVDPSVDVFNVGWIR
jgi:hypothetical protein